jgi:UDP-2-acetamido-3-amino-2,3-dideoxy-glucuronate N-acetyltransferase
MLGTVPGAVGCDGGTYLSHGIADVTLMTMRFPGGVRAHVFVSWLHPFKEHRFVVVGDRQMAVFDDTAPWSDKLLLYPHRVEWLHGRVPLARKAEAVPVALLEDEPLRAACLHFAACVRTRSIPLSDAASGIQVLEVLEAAERALRRGESPPSSRVAPPSLASKDHIHVHPTATIDEGAEIGAGTRIWHYSHVMRGARIGRHCSLGQNVFVGEHVVIGDNVKIQNNVSIYEGVYLEDDVFCGPSVVFTNVRNPRSDVNRKGEYVHTLVKRGATIGANSTIVCGVTLGDHSFVGAGAVVTHDVPNHRLVIGVPARNAGWACHCGERLEMSDGQGMCNRCGSVFSVRDDLTLDLVVR